MTGTPTLNAHGTVSSSRRRSRPNRNATGITPMAFGEGMLEVSRILAVGMLRHKQREMKRVQNSPKISPNGLAKSADKSVNDTNPALD